MDYTVDYRDWVAEHFVIEDSVIFKQKGVILSDYRRAKIKDNLYAYVDDSVRGPMKYKGFLITNAQDELPRLLSSPVIVRIPHYLRAIFEDYVQKHLPIIKKMDVDNPPF